MQLDPKINQANHIKLNKCQYKLEALSVPSFRAAHYTEEQLICRSLYIGFGNNLHTLNTASVAFQHRLYREFVTNVTVF